MGPTPVPQDTSLMDESFSFGSGSIEPPNLSLGSYNSSMVASPRPGFKSTFSSTSNNIAGPSKTTSRPSPFSHRRQPSSSKTITGVDDDDVPPTPRFEKHPGLDEEAEDNEGATDTPMKPRRNGTVDSTTTVSRANRPRHTMGGAAIKGGAQLTLREQEKVIDLVKKENFDLKLKVHFLEERLGQLAPDQTNMALKHNVNLKIEVQSQRVDIKKLKKANSELEKENESLQQKLDEANGDGRELAALRAEYEQALADIDRLESKLRNAPRAASAHDQGTILELQQLNDEHLDRIDRLEQDLDATHAALQDARAALQDADTSRDDTQSGKTNRLRLEAKVRELEDINAQLEREVQMQADEIDRVMDEQERLQLALEESERRREGEAIQRSESVAHMLEEAGAREFLEEEKSLLQDRIATTELELDESQRDIAILTQELEEKSRDYVVLSEETDVLVGDIRQLEQECDELSQRNEQLEDGRNNLQEVIAELEVALADKDKELEHREGQIEGLQIHIDNLEADLASTNAEIERLDAINIDLEASLDKANAETQQMLDKIKQAEELSGALTEKLATARTQLSEQTELRSQLESDIIAHHDRQKELARHAEDLSSELQDVKEDRAKLEDSVMVLEEKLRELGKEWDSELEAWKLEKEELERQRKVQIRAKEEELHKTQLSVESLSAECCQRKEDLEALQSALRTKEDESRKLGETHTTNRFSLELELDRLKRDLARCEDDVERLKKEVEAREARLREKEIELDRLHSEKRDLSHELSAQRQSTENAAERLETMKIALKTAESEVAKFREASLRLEARLQKEEISLVATDRQYQDQISERNQLLMTIFNYLEKILGVEKIPKKGGVAEAKPLTNFPVFHDNLISRLDRLVGISTSFEKTCKELEAKYADKLGPLQKQLDMKWKRMDKVDDLLKPLAEAKASWRRKYNIKEGELDACKATNSELQAQLVAQKRLGTPGPETPDRDRSSDRRVIVLQNRLAQSQDQFQSINDKLIQERRQWEARVKEYEARQKAAEEKVRRERQGAKERHNEQDVLIKQLREEIDAANRRKKQVKSVMRTASVSHGGEGQG